MWSKRAEAVPLTSKLDAAIFYSDKRGTTTDFPKIFFNAFSRPVQRGISALFVDEKGEYGAIGGSAIKCYNSIHVRNMELFLNDDNHHLFYI